MSRKTTAIVVCFALAALAAPAGAYNITLTGQTRASPRLSADILTKISSYSKASGGCAMLFSADRRVMTSTYAARSKIRELGPAGHYEEWLINACAKKQVFQIGMWNSPHGGSDFSVRPLTGRMSLTADVH